MNKIESLKGMHDAVPTETPRWQYLERVVAELAAAYGYGEIRLPLLEQTELFARSIGEVTDIVEKEMYTFPDRNGLSVTLRPEGTAGCVRAAEQAGLLYNQTAKLWYRGPMFRYERPQKGRLRQFHQFGFEAFGYRGPDVDAELLLMLRRLWDRLGLRDSVVLELNNLGQSEDRARYREALVAYLTRREADLDEDSKRRLGSNPLRVLDSKNPAMAAVVAEAPELFAYLGDESRRHFDELCELLTLAGVDFNRNSRLVRGLDYYSDTVFEWVTSALGAQGTVCGGGRYDGLVAQLGGRATPAIGCGMGVERLLLLIEAVSEFPAELERIADVYVCHQEVALAAVLQLAEDLRGALPRLRVHTHLGTSSLKNQLKKADKTGAAVALIIGAEELAAGVVQVKQLASGEQTPVAVAELADRLRTLMVPR